MASVKQLQAQAERLKARIDTRQQELAELKAKYKEVREQLAEAKQAGKAK